MDVGLPAEVCSVCGTDRAQEPEGLGDCGAWLSGRAVACQDMSGAYILWVC